MSEPVSDRIEGRQGLRAALCQAVVQAADAGAHHMIWVDANFAHWPLDDPGLLEALKAWARPGHSLQLLANDWVGVLQAYPRFVRWRRDFGHLVQAAQMPADAAALPTLLLADRGQGLVVSDAERFIGVRLTQPRVWIEQRERVDAWLQQSTPGFAVTTLGL